MAYLSDENKERLSKLVASLKWHEHEVKTIVRKNKDTQENELMVSEKRTLVRWAECPHPKDCVGLIEFLASDECLPLLQLSGETLESGNWRPTIAWFEQEESTRASERSSPRTFKIYHALRNKTDDNGIDGPYVLNDGCRSKTTATFYWEVDAIPECPASTSGKHYVLNIRSRDANDGTYDCVITCTENIEYDVDPHLTHQDKHNDVTRAEYLGVRGDTTTDVVNKAIAKATVDGLITSDKEGVTVDMSVRKLDDCTSDIVVLNTEHVANEDFYKRTREGAVNSVTELAGKNLPSTTVNAATWTPSASTNDFHNIGAAREGVGTLVEVVKQYTDGGVRDVTVREHKAYRWIKSVQLAADRNGGIRKRVIFHNVTEKQLEDLAESMQDISFQVNEFGLWDGSGTEVVRWADSGGAGGIDTEDQYDQYTFGMSQSSASRKLNSGEDQIFIIGRFFQKRSGIVRDHFIQEDTSNNPYLRINGLLEGQVGHKGHAHDGFWQYAGLTWSVEAWFVKDGSSTYIYQVSPQIGRVVLKSSTASIAPTPNDGLWKLLWEFLGGLPTDSTGEESNGDANE